MMQITQIFNTSPHLGLIWGVSEPFRDYTSTSIHDGKITVSAPAFLVEGEAAYFPVDVASSTTEEMRFCGALHFTGHNGLLAVTISQPHVVLTDGQLELTIQDPFPGPSSRMSIAKVDGQTLDTALTEEGADLFMGNYPEGQELEPLKLMTKQDANAMRIDESVKSA